MAEIGKFSKKHGADAKPDPRIQSEMLDRAQDGAIPCALAFDIARKLNVEPSEAGKTADLLEYRIVKCQLGLFGYAPKKKIIEPLNDVQDDMKKEIREHLIGDILPCKSAWDIAQKFSVPKLHIGSICETLGIKIKECQLGAF